VAASAGDLATHELFITFQGRAPIGITHLGRAPGARAPCGVDDVREEGGGQHAVGFANPGAACQKPPCLVEDRFGGLTEVK
jgi:hypothetical protein